MSLMGSVVREGLARRPPVPGHGATRELQRSAVHDVLDSQGQPLAASVQEEMQDRLGADFSGVRVHADAAARASAAELGARAYTSGSHVVIGDGGADMHTLAHELAHVIQQRQGPVAGTDQGDGVKVSDPSDRFERAAAAAATQAMSGSLSARGAVPAQLALPLAPRATGGGRPVVVQRHSSFEHMLLGDARPADLGQVITGIGDPKMLCHALLQELERIARWAKEPGVDWTQEAKKWQVGAVLLKGSKLALTYGEINTLPDYFSNPQDLDRLPPERVVPIVQFMRHHTFDKIVEWYLKYGGEKHDIPKAVFPHEAEMGAIDRGLEGAAHGAGETAMLKRLTMDRDTENYGAVLARNACHFAPYSWERWEALHVEARHLAELSAGKASAPPHGDRPMSMRPEQGDSSQELARKAYLTNGFADHFLQDSFAAGHLVNKTKIMAWFARWLAGAQSDTLGLAAITKFLDHLSAEERSRLFSEQMYPSSKTNPRGRSHGTTPGGSIGSSSALGESTDPQTAQEQPNYQARVKASGVPQHLYELYLAFMSSSVVQQASNAVHDTLNVKSLRVGSPKRHNYQVWGDDTLLTGGWGAFATAEAAKLSRESIFGIIDNRPKAVTSVEEIRQYFPTEVEFEATIGKGEVMEHFSYSGSLLGWMQDGGQFHQYCRKELFPQAHYVILNNKFLKEYFIKGFSQDVKPSHTWKLFGMQEEPEG